MKILMLVSLTTSTALMFLTHPISILLMILLNTLMVCILSWMLMKSTWMSFILFIIFLGGLMVLFVYITSLASNEKFEIDFKNLMWLPIITMLLFMAMNNSLMLQNKVKMIKTFTLISPSFSLMNSIFIIMIMIYLFIALLVAVKISTKFEGPLRNSIK